MGESLSAALARASARALDPTLLARAAGIEADDWQATLLRSTARQMILLCARQSGKSTVAALLAIDEALHRPPALVLILAPALRQATELFRKCKDILAALGDDVPTVTQENVLSMELVTGSRIVCLPGRDATIRGFSRASLLVIDEAARVPDDLYMALRPMLSVSRGRVILLSTPFGRRGFFFSEYESGGPDWQRIRVTAYDCPRISREWLDQERQQIGEWWFAQEYMCEFVDTVDQVFATEIVMQALSADITPLAL